MPRIRTVKPEFFSNEELAKCSPHARLLAIALLQLADSEGRMRWIPSQVMAHAFPWETLDLSLMVHELCSVKYLVIYEANGREYACIPAFNAHQRITGKEATCKSKFPPMNQLDMEGKPECFTGKQLGAQEQGNKGTREQDSPKNKFSEKDYECAEFIAKGVIDAAPSAKPNLKKWAEVIRLMRERDSKAHPEICAMFTWANNDSFWRANILSPDKLRKQWATLEAQKLNDQNNNKKSLPAWDDKNGWIELGKKHNTNPKAGESWKGYQARLTEIVEKGEG